jgi:hypothetical protein
MTWLILLSHAFNPLLLSFVLKQQYGEETATDSGSLANIFPSVITSFIFYLFWLGAHYLIMKIAGYNFDFGEFIGVGKGMAYFLPFILGLAILMIDILALLWLKLEKSLVLVSNLRGITLFFGSYFMLINYLSWLAN